jgi:hypothetical protein
LDSSAKGADEKALIKVVGKYMTALRPLIESGAFDDEDALSTFLAHDARRSQPTISETTFTALWFYTQDAVCVCVSCRRDMAP